MRHTRALSLRLIVPDRAGCRRLLWKAIRFRWKDGQGAQHRARLLVESFVAERDKRAQR